MSWTKPLAVLVIVVLLLGWLWVKRQGGPPPGSVEHLPAPSVSSPSSPREPAVRPLFEDAQVPALALNLDAQSLQSLRLRPREWAPAVLRVGDETYSRVAVHIKGSQGSLQPIDARPSLTVSFHKLGGEGKFHGIRKIHLNNCAEDPSFMTEILCSELCRAAGLPAARSGYATLTLNGRRLGLYVLSEGLTKEFLAQFFTRTDGNLYDGGFRRDIDQPLERIGGQGPDSQADRLALIAAVRQPDPEARWTQLQQVLDMDRFMSLLAMSTLLWNWDGYPMARNNYRIYHDPSSDRLVFFPHGMDQMFWEPDGPIFPPLQGMVARAVMRLPEGRALYQERLAAVHANVFRLDSIEARIDSLVAQIRPYRHDAVQQGARLKRLIKGRWQSVSAQLSACAP